MLGRRMLLETYDTNTIALWGEPERRRRLVRLCATISGDSNAAEDLAQETLLEAWRNAHKLHDPSGADRWLAAIARSEEHTSELQSHSDLVCRLLLEKKNNTNGYFLNKLKQIPSAY